MLPNDMKSYWLPVTGTLLRNRVLAENQLKRMSVRGGLYPVWPCLCERENLMDWKDSSVGRVLAVHATDLGSITGTP